MLEGILFAIALKNGWGEVFCNIVGISQNELLSVQNEGKENGLKYDNFVRSVCEICTFKDSSVFGHNLENFKLVNLTDSASEKLF